MARCFYLACMELLAFDCTVEARSAKLSSVREHDYELYLHHPTNVQP